MIQNEAIEKLLSELSGCGVCQTGKRYLDGSPRDMATLVKVWRGWPEYLYEHSEFALSVLRKYLDGPAKEILAQEAIYVDHKGSAITHEASRVFFMGDSVADLQLDDYAVATIYLFNSAKVTLHCGENACVSVETFDDSRLNIYGGEKGRITVYKYDRSIVTGAARIKPKEYKRGEVFNGRENDLKTNEIQGNNPKFTPRWKN